MHSGQLPSLAEVRSPEVLQQLSAEQSAVAAASSAAVGKNNCDCLSHPIRVIKRSALPFPRICPFKSIVLLIAAISQHGGAQRRDEESRRTHEGPQLDISAVDVVAVPVLKK